MWGVWGMRNCLEFLFSALWVRAAEDPGHTPPLVSPARLCGLLLYLAAACALGLLLRGFEMKKIILSSSAIEDFAASHKLLFKPENPTQGTVHEYAYSQDMTKRYAYSQTWDISKPKILWVMLNPGTGETEVRRRNTLERCKLWSMDWGFGGLLIGNVFATRTKSAKDLSNLGKEQDLLNESALRLLRTLASETVVAWGGKGRLQDRAKQLAPLLGGATCLGFTANGEPRHPLYVPKATNRTRW